jgi:hypothetical protein
MAEAAVGSGALGDLRGELAGRGENQHPAGAALRPLGRSGEPVDRRKHEGRGLAGAGLGDSEQVLALEQDRDRLLLDRGRGRIFLQGKRLEDGLRKPEIFKRHGNSLVSCSARAQPERRAQTRRVFANPREKGRLQKVRNGAGPSGRSRCNDVSLRGIWAQSVNKSTVSGLSPSTAPRNSRVPGRAPPASVRPRGRPAR